MANNIPKGIPGWNVPDNVLVNKTRSPQSTKINLSPEKHDALVLNQGVRIKIYRSSLCPNVKSIDGAEHEIDCPLCHGAQFVDRYPLDSWAFIQAQALEKPHFTEGQYDGNSVYATFLQGVELQYFTLIELCDFTETFYERIQRSSGPVDHVRYRATRINLLMDSDGVEYFEGSHFNIDINGNIRWKAGKGPSAEKIYTLNYSTKVRFRAEKAMHSNRFAQIEVSGGVEMVKMNEQWQLAKDYLVERKDLSGNLIEPNPLPEHEITDND